MMIFGLLELSSYVKCYVFLPLVLGMPIDVHTQDMPVRSRIRCWVGSSTVARWTRRGRRTVQARPR